MFTIIEDGIALLRAPKGVYRQAKVYHYNGRVYVGYGSGFIRVCVKLGDKWATSHPDILVIALEGDGIDFASGEPRFGA